MRFDIGPGGAFVILVGLVGLSGAVFALGLVAGHELASDEPVQEATTAYPMPAQPVTAPSARPSNIAVAPAAMPSAMAPAAAPSSGVAALPGAPATPATAYAPPPEKTASQVASKPGSSRDKQLGEAIERIRKRVSGETGAAQSASARVTFPPPGDEVKPPPAADYSAPAPSPLAARPAVRALANAPAPPKPRVAMAPPAAPRHHPYSVQIDAIMDQQGAQRMAAKLRARGFEPYIVRTDLNGQTWYRVRVGHYGTPAEAKAAEARLHQEFGNTPGVP